MADKGNIGHRLSKPAVTVAISAITPVEAKNFNLIKKKTIKQYLL